MTDIDVSVVLNMHREALFLSPTIRSLERCAQVAEAAGIVVELIAVFDRSDDDTMASFREHDLSVFARVQEVEVDVGSLGLARNAGIAHATGEYIWTADADDLVSSNAIVALLETARGHAGGKVAVFMEYLCAFGEQYHNSRYISSKYLTAADFAFGHPYVSRIFIRREVFEVLCYDDLRVSSGFAYEDWHLNSQLRAFGFDMIIAPETVIFYRQRADSLLRQANAASVGLIPHSRLFDVDAFLADMQECRRRVGDWAGFLSERKAISAENNTERFMRSVRMLGFLEDAARLEPEIEPHKLEAAGSYSPLPWNQQHWGMQLEGFYRMLGDQKFTDIVWLPWLNQGGAEKYILQVLEEVSKQEPDARFLVLAGESAQRHEWVDRLPRGSVFIDVYNAFPWLDNPERDAMTIRAMLAVAVPGARLHIKPAVFSHRLLDSYAPVLKSKFRIIYYRFSDEAYSWRDMKLRGGWGTSMMRRHLPGFWRVLTDCEAIVKADGTTLGPLPKYQTLYAKSHCSLAPARSQREPRKRLLWASRIATEKRPELVVKIASGLEAAGLDVFIDAYGAAAPGVDARAIFSGASGKVTYKGAFGSARELPVDDYDMFLYTSSFDGLPNILLEMSGVGLPSVAPNVGGIGEVVINDVTGKLVDAADDDGLVSAYVTAICSLYQDGAERSALAERAQHLVDSRHGAAAFSENVSKLLCLAAEDNNRSK